MATAIRKSTVDAESYFGIDEMFFSHTDRKGKILYGNDVFVRVSEHSEAELIGKPHNVIRHPDMPRSVFRLLWDTILSDKPIAAYVKNRSKTGKYYWVLALVVPFQGGFLSIRIKPSSELLATVSEVYSKALAAEDLNDRNMDKGLEVIVGAITGLGFSNYNEFMIEALTQEVLSRYKKVSEKDSDVFHFRVRSYIKGLQSLDRLWMNCKKLEKDANSLLKIFKQLNFLCVNLSTSAHKYGQAGVTISVTSDTFSKWGKEIEDSIREFASKREQLKNALSEARIKLSFAALELDLADFFSKTPGSNSEYENSLRTLAESDSQLAMTAVGNLRGIFNSYFASLEKLRESLLAMKIIRLNSKLESVYLPDSGQAIESTVKNLSQFLESIESQTKTLTEITRASVTLMNEVARSVAA